MGIGWIGAKREWDCEVFAAAIVLLLESGLTLWSKHVLVEHLAGRRACRQGLTARGCPENLWEIIQTSETLCMYRGLLEGKLAS